VPVERPAPQVPYASLESEGLKLAYDELSEAYALALVKETFFHYEGERTKNHDVRWNTHDALYCGYVPPKVWEGTNTPRSNLSSYIVFDQVETALPVISQALFGDQEEWFQAIGESDEASEVKAAKDVQAALAYSVEHVHNEVGLTAKNEIDLAAKFALIYGNGFVEIFWDAHTNQPRLQCVDIRDIYVDPGTPVSNIDECRSVVQRRMMTVDELELLRSDKRLKIPDHDVMVGMSRRTPVTRGDLTKQTAAAYAGFRYTASQEHWSPMPSERRIEVLRYASKHRIIWVLNREWVALNITNIYGFIPYCSAPCFSLPGRFYAQSIADVQEGNQRYIEDLLNGRVDQQALNLFPPRAVKRGALMTPRQQRWGPGALYQLGDSKDIQSLAAPQVHTNIYPELEYIERMSAKRTGIPELNQPRSGNISRTTSGVQAQQSGALTRMQFLVKNFEDYLIIPALYKMRKMFQFHTEMFQQVPAFNRDSGQFYSIPAHLFQHPLRFRVLASSKMLSQQRLLQMFPPLAQTLLSGPFQSELMRTGKTIDFEALFQLLKDATGVSRRYTLVRDLSEEEKKASQEPPPEVQAEQQKAQQDAQVRLQMGQMKVESQKSKNEADIQRELIKKQPDPAEQQQEAAKMQMEAARATQDLQFEQIKAQVDMQRKQAELRAKLLEIVMKQRQSQMELAAKAQESQMDTQIQARSAAQDEAIKFRQAQVDEIQALRAERQQKRAQKSRPTGPKESR